MSHIARGDPHGRRSSGSATTDLAESGSTFSLTRRWSRLIVTLFSTQYARRCRPIRRSDVVARGALVFSLDRLMLLARLALAFVCLSTHSSASREFAFSNAGSRHLRGGVMEQLDQPASRNQAISRRTLRLTIKSTAKGLEL